MGQLAEFDKEIAQLLAGNDLQKETDAAAQISSDLIDSMMEIKTMIEEKTAPPPTRQLPPTNGQSTSQGTSGDASGGSGNAQLQYKLPKFEMSTFAGDHMKWRGWWEIYKRAIDDNTSLSKVDKFTYLLGYLDGDAKALAEGYELSENNYDQVIDELKARWGDKQRAQFSHFESLFDITGAKNRSLAEVQRVASEHECHIRSLVALGMNEEEFCVCYIPMLLRKLPTYLATKIVEKNGIEKWSMSKVRQWIREDLQAREVVEKSGISGDGPQKNGQRSGERKVTSTASLIAPGGDNRGGGGDRSRYCVFCDNGSHFSDKCLKYKDVPSRKSCLGGKGRNYCYVCLSTNCRDRRRCPAANTECWYCHTTGHHQSLCYAQFPKRGGGNGRGGSGGRGRGGRGFGGRHNDDRRGGTNSGSGAEKDVEKDKGETPRKEKTNSTVAVTLSGPIKDVAFMPTDIGRHNG